MPQHGVFIVWFVNVGWEWRLFREMGRERARGTVQGGGVGKFAALGIRPPNGFVDFEVMVNSEMQRVTVN